MKYKGMERRTCRRFKIPGAVISYRMKKSLFSRKNYEEEFCPVLDLSRAGIRFQGQRLLDINSENIMRISVPGERVPLILKGQVRWQAFDFEKYKYQAGIRFNPYGENKEENYPGLMTKIIELEQKFSS
jgi:hypothetical protein